jgi:hypothetical protein
VIGATFRFLLPASETPIIESEPVEGAETQNEGPGSAAHTEPQAQALPSTPPTPASGA